MTTTTATTTTTITAVAPTPIILHPKVLCTLDTGHCTCAQRLLYSSASSGHWSLYVCTEAAQLLRIILHTCATCGGMPCKHLSCSRALTHACTSMASTSMESKHLSPAKQHTMDKSSGRGLPHNLSNCWTLDTALRLMIFFTLPF